jgi:Fe-S oxidoreductase
MSKVSIHDLPKKTDGPITQLSVQEQIPLPPPFDKIDQEPKLPALSAASAEKYVNLDGTIGVRIPKPKTKEEEDRLVNGFISGMRKLFNAGDNWTFLQPLVISMEHCARCQTCSESCHIYAESGRNPIYRPNYRSEIFRRLYFKHVKEGGGGGGRGDIDLTWQGVARLIELAYRCNLCRRCTQTCPIGVDNGLMAREIRKVASQELGISPRELHGDGSMLQQKVGSSTGMSSVVVKDNMDFIDEDMTEKTGLVLKTPWDKEGADVLLMHNAGEILAWPENPGAFGVLMEAAGVSWTLSSELAAYDSINYGAFYDDVQLARTLIMHMQAAKKLKVKKIIVGECGHAHKVMSVISDKILTGDLNIPRESSLTFMADLVKQGRLRFDKSRNDFPVTLHDPCNITRLMGIVQPQRDIIHACVPAERFHEMTPHGVNNYCCGGGSGFAIISGNNFSDWRFHTTGRRKLRQILTAFENEPMDRDHPKYVCAPCSNCKGQIRDLLKYYDAWEKAGINYGGLVELMVNALKGSKPGFIDWEWH